ncbi:hypothetical protein [Celeribacter halophilus]|uniref:hypothetical protein n=1 Tax=Celeribacter halophilus TaxID=576117 RepID=UPI003A92B67A
MKHFFYVLLFLRSDEGAVTVDWVVLSAAIIGMTVSFMITFSEGLSTVTANISEEMLSLDFDAE